MAMRGYEQILQDACVEVENSCSSCGEFGSQLVTVNENWLRLAEVKLKAAKSLYYRMNLKFNSAIANQNLVLGQKAGDHQILL
jgi:hypothetical protein